MKFNYREVEQSIGRWITNQPFFYNSFFVFKTHFRNNGGFPKNQLLLIFNLIRLKIAEGWFVEMFLSVWGALKMMDARKIPIGRGSDLVFKDLRPLPEQARFLANTSKPSYKWWRQFWNSCYVAWSARQLKAHVLLISSERTNTYVSSAVKQSTA